MLNYYYAFTETSLEITKLVWIVGKHVHGATGLSCQN
jgi:hypothetical protein